MVAFQERKRLAFQQMLFVNKQMGLEPLKSPIDRVYLLKCGFTEQQIGKLYNEIYNIKTVGVRWLEE